VSKIREKELHLLKLVALLTTATCLCWSAAPFLVALSTFGTYTFILGQTLTPEIAFVALSLFNIIRMPVAGFATVSAQATQTAISMKRLKEFLAEEEVENERRECGKGDDETNGENGNGGIHGKFHAKIMNLEIAVQINVGNFGWDKTAAEGPFLKNINLSIPKGSFVIIFGPIGSGKSSILSAILSLNNILFH
jgi:ABC-type multidrug transport system fused ATPase/permease subunit